MFKVKWTTAQSSLGHFALSLLVTIVMSVFTAGAQYLYSGKFNGQELAVIASAAFIAAFSRGIISLENNPNLMPAILDSINELRTLTVQQPAPIAPQGPPVVVNVTHPPTVEQPAPQPSIRSLNAFPVPPRPLGPPPIQMPVVQQPDIAAQTTAEVPVPVQSVPDVPQRSFDSGVLRAVQSGQ